MGARIRGVAVLAVVLAVGAFLGSAVGQWWPRGGVAETDPDPATASPVRAPDERIQIEVLNGGGRPGMARRATDHLRDLGFDVVYYGNRQPYDQETSTVLDRVGRRQPAELVATALGIARVRSEPDTNLYLDVTVVLGARWEPPPEPVGDTVESVPAWWDLRRFFVPDGGPREPEIEPRGRMADPGEDGTDDERDRDR